MVARFLLRIEGLLQQIEQSFPILFGPKQPPGNYSLLTIHSINLKLPFCSAPSKVLSHWLPLRIHRSIHPALVHHSRWKTWSAMDSCGQCHETVALSKSDGNGNSVRRSTFWKSFNRRQRSECVTRAGTTMKWDCYVVRQSDSTEFF